jgi:uncharacterized Ntn-hydrolase superfamily protein
MKTQIGKRMLVGVAASLMIAAPLMAQEPVDWGTGPEVEFHTFSIVAVDPRTGETGTIVTSRVTCVGHIVPWVRAGVGAVATQGGARLEYGNELLDLLAKGVPPQQAMDRTVAADEGRENRQVGVIDMKGNSAQWTGKQQYGAEKQGDWVHMRKGTTFAVQGNALVSPKIVDVITDVMQASEGSERTLADRLIEALYAGQVLGGDFRHGSKQSAALLIADPRPGRARRGDGVSVNLNVCEHPEPVGELRRMYDAMTETLGFRRLEQFAGRDILQLKLMLHALGHFRPNEKELALTGADARIYTEEAVKALDAFRIAEEMGTTVPGYVDARVIDRLWSRLKAKGLDVDVRRRLSTLTGQRGR